MRSYKVYGRNHFCRDIIITQIKEYLIIMMKLEKSLEIYGEIFK
jgi:hypothetical protein